MFRKSMIYLFTLLLEVTILANDVYDESTGESSNDFQNALSDGIELPDNLMKYIKLMIIICITLMRSQQ